MQWPEDLLSPNQLEKKYSPDGGGQHPQFPRRQWREAVANDATLLGYWFWVSHELDACGQKARLVA